MIHSYKKYISSILFILIISLCQAQTPQITYELQSNESGATKTYIARDQIVLKPGFKFESPSTNTFNAKIDAGLLFPPAENTYILPNGEITTDPALGAVVGSIPGQFAVSPSGAATYTIPIECPSGINGVQPNVSLVYNSQGGNGIAGWGWGISSLSSISVNPRNIFSHDEVKGINLTEMIYLQRFTLDGNALVLKSGTSGLKTYTTETEMYVKIVNDNTKFIVTTKDGTVMEYAHRLFPQKISPFQSTSGAYSWLLTKMTDSKGNYMLYSYKSNSANTQTVLDKIEYTGNGSTVPTLKIEFNYIGKSEPVKYFVGGYYLEDYYLLKNIAVKSGALQVRKYELTHLLTNDKYFLTAVKLKGEYNDKLNATSFEWGEDSEVINVNTTSINNPSTYMSEITNRVFSSGDIDGDGVSDLIEFYRRDDYSYRIDESNFSKNTGDHVKVSKMKLENGSVVYDQTILDAPLGASFSVDDFTNVNSIGCVAGFNGSQKKTLLIPCYTLFNGVKSFKLKDVKGVVLDCPLKYTSSIPSFVIGDINNDGIDEIIIIEKTSDDSPATPDYQNGTVCYIKKNDLSQEYLHINDEVIVTQLNFDSRIPNTTTHPEIKEVLLSDFNADGLKDLMICTSAGYFIMKNNGGVKGADGIVRVGFTQLPTLYTSITMSDKQSVIKGGDFNGDGMLDFLLYDGDDGFTLHLNNGNFEFTQHQVSNLVLVEDVFEGAETSYKNDDKDDYIITDFNHDGKSDLIIIDVNYERACGWILLGACMSPYAKYVDTTIKWYVSDGTSFTLEKSITLIDEKYYYKGYASSGDFNGDGREDLFSYASNIYTGNSTSVNGYVYSSFNNNFEANLIKSIYSGLGAKYSINYQPLTFNKYNTLDFYVKESSAVYPIADVQTPSYCVRKVQDKAINGTMNNLYTYAGAKVQLHGKGYLGYTNQTVIDSLHNMKIVTNSELNYDYCLPTKHKQTTYGSDNEVIAVSENQYANSFSGGIYTSLPSKAIETDNLKVLSKTTDYISYDSNGNLLESKISQGQLITEQTIDYDQFGSWSWGDNMPVSVTTESSYMGSTIEQIVHYDYDVNTGLIISETTNPNNLLYTITEYDDYDNFGRPTIIRVKAKDKDGLEQTRTTFQTYTSQDDSASGRFITSKTNVLGETTTYNWDETRGLLISETTKDKTTSYTYDKFGRLKEAIYPDGNRKTEVLQWASPGNAIGAKYYSYSQTSGSAPVTVWYDALGREIQKDTYGLNGRIISVSTEYYELGINKGRKYRVSEPYFEEDAASKIWAQTYSEYDPYGRPTTVATPLGNVTTAYGGLITTVTSPEGTKTTIMNSIGLVAVSIVNQKVVSYTYYPSGLTKTATPYGGQALAMEYNLQGKRTKLTDPDAGVIETRYNGFGELVEEKQKVHNDNFITTINNFEPTTGRLSSIVRNGETTSYVYDSINRLISINIPGHLQILNYDKFDRVTNIKEEVGSKIFNRATEYDALGRILKETYPSGYYTFNSYDNDYGFLTEVKDRYGRQLWKAVSENAKGQLTEVQRGGVTTNYGFDSKGLPTSIQAPGILKLRYSFENNGNLAYRQDSLGSQYIQKEVFQYDGLNRLTNWDIYQNNVLNKSDGMVYNPTTGTITSKSDLDNLTMLYGDNGKPHALTGIDGVPSVFPTDSLNVSYTDFKKIKTLTQGNKHYVLTYGVDDQRRKSECKINGVTQSTRYYLSDYEEEIDNVGNTKKIHYLSGGAILINTNGVETLYYGYNDYQGSLIALANDTGTVVERYAFDPWGKRRNPADWTEDDSRTSWTINRGYTMHEHLDAFNIINMNGRVYDPLTAMFFSPDPFVQAPGNWLNYNRYGYAFGNPFKYTDPDGEVAWFVPIIYFAIYAGIEYMTQVHHNIQASKEMVASGFDPMSKKDMLLGRIDWFDVAFNGVGGAVAAIVQPAAPYIMYGTPVFTNMFNWYGDGSTQNVFDGSIPINQYLINTALEEGSLYMTNVIKTGLATPQKDIWNPENHTKYFTKEVFGKKITGRSVEDLIQQGIASWMDYTMKATFYPEFNPDRLTIDGVPAFPQTPNIPTGPPNNPEFQRYNNVRNNRINMGGALNDLEKHLRLTINPVR